ncbi:MAG TPA: hypothetical protein VMV92_41575 [Streptosporangiaceae bacterium]|nr:hypothetical protein [Streptosporangiaceae bacterium]
MIGKITAPRGVRVEPLIWYLYGPGRANEHTDPHIVAGWRHPAELEPPLREDGGRDFRRLNGLLNQPHAAMGERGYARPVWHCSLRAAPGDKMLSDDEWAVIAQDVMDRTGLSPRGQEDDAVRWVAVQHAEDHVHIVAMLARQDRGRPSLHNDRYRVRDACLAAEARHGLAPTAAADRTAHRHPTRAENEKAARRRLPGPPRVTLRREVATAAAASASEGEFFDRLDRAGVLVRPRYSVTSPGEVTGYAVALPGDTGGDGGPVWFSGGKLAADLTWPKLCRGWRGARPGPPRPGPDRLTAAGRNAIWDQAARAAAEATARIRLLAVTDPAGAADAAWAAAGVLRTAGAALGSQILAEAADAYDRAARPPHARMPAPTEAGGQLRHAARLIAACSRVTGDPALTPLVLLARLAALAETVAVLRDTQRRAAQAAAAAGAGHIRACRYLARPASLRARAATLAAASFPAGPPAPGAAPARSGTGQHAPPPARRPGPPRPRGPTR